MLGLLIGFSSHCNSLYHLFLFFSQMTHPSVTEQCHGKPTQPWRLCQSSTFPLPCAPASALGGRWDFKPPPAPLGQGGDHVLVGHYIPVHIPGWVCLQICHAVSLKRRQKPQHLWSPEQTCFQEAAELFNLWHNQFFCLVEIAHPQH